MLHGQRDVSHVVVAAFFIEVERVCCCSNELKYEAVDIRSEDKKRRRESSHNNIRFVECMGKVRWQSDKFYFFLCLENAHIYYFIVSSSCDCPGIRLFHSTALDRNMCGVRVVRNLI